MSQIVKVFTDEINHLPLYLFLTCTYANSYGHGRKLYSLADAVMGNSLRATNTIAGYHRRNNPWKTPTKFINRHRFIGLRGVTHAASFEAFEYEEKSERKRFKRDRYQYRLTPGNNQSM
jgi:hypothetical protein